VDYAHARLFTFLYFVRFSSLFHRRYRINRHLRCVLFIFCLFFSFFFCFFVVVVFFVFFFTATGRACLPLYAAFSLPAPPASSAPFTHALSSFTFYDNVRNQVGRFPP
jgi:hypothetical protein